MLRKFCRCGVLIPQGKKMCEKCEEKFNIRNRFNESNKEAYRRYKANRTDTKEQSFYSSRDWIFTREAIKKRDKGLCLLCLSKDKISYVDNVHHIEELKEAWSLRLSMSNLVCLCKRCHYYVHLKYKRSEEDKVEVKKKLKELIKKGGGV